MEPTKELKGTCDRCGKLLEALPMTGGEEFGCPDVMCFPFPPPTEQEKAALKALCEAGVLHEEQDYEEGFEVGRPYIIFGDTEPEDIERLIKFVCSREAKAAHDASESVVKAVEESFSQEHKRFGGKPNVPMLEAARLAASKFSIPTSK